MDWSDDDNVGDDGFFSVQRWECLKSLFISSESIKRLITANPYMHDDD